MRTALAFFIFAILTYAYLYPGSEALLVGRTDVVMSDDTDPAPLPYVYDQLVRVWKEQPSLLLHGAVLLPVAEPVRGFPYWISWNERIAVVMGSFFVPNEQLSTWVVAVFMLVSALSMYALSRTLKWNHWIAIGLAIAWAFSAYVRARAKVHNGFAGTFHVPLIFLALVLILQGRNLRSLFLATLSLLVASTVAYYYVITTIFLSPFFLSFLLLHDRIRQDWRHIASRFFLAITPTLLFLGLSFAFPLPSQSGIDRSAAFPKTGEASGYEYHPFLDWYAARPIDYLGSDISLHNEADDWNPLRQWINRRIIENLGNSNTHERTNGISWIILILAGLGLTIALRNSRVWLMHDEKKYIFFFASLAFFGFWLSLSPQSPSPAFSPSYWLYSLFSQVRVSSRAGLWAHFALLMLAGQTMQAWLRRHKKSAWLAAIFPLLIIIDRPPFYQTMPMSTIREPYKALQRSQGACGVGMYFPFLNHDRTSVNYYHFLQRLRESDCFFLNAFASNSRADWMIERFPASMDFIRSLSTNPIASLRLKRLVNCVPLSFVVFDPVVPLNWARQTCKEIGWRLDTQGVCLAPDRGRAFERFPDECGF